MRVAADHAQFGLPEVKVGVPSVVDAALLQEHVGLTMAKEIILTGDLYSATELFGLRLLNRMVPLEQLHDETLSLLAKVTRHTTTVLASQKRLFETWLNSSLQDGIDASVEEFARVFEMAETREQVRKYRSLAGRR
jgi:enoyl-CoA hydratase/carnithine racemase